MIFKDYFHDSLKNVVKAGRIFSMISNPCQQVISTHEQQVVPAGDEHEQQVVPAGDDEQQVVPAGDAMSEEQQVVPAGDDSLTSSYDDVDDLRASYDEVIGGMMSMRPSAAPESKDSKESKNNIRYKIYKKIEK